MTTQAAERLYLAEHEAQWDGTPYAVYNPEAKPLSVLPVIYGFNNGGEPGWMSGVLLAEDGTCLGGHVCSHEGYMRHDLGVLEGSRPDRHETFRKHYPGGYRMAFVSYEDGRTHAGLQAAFARNTEQKNAGPPELRAIHGKKYNHSDAHAKTTGRGFKGFLAGRETTESEGEQP